PLNYAANARESYPVFARRKADGTLPADIRFMVCMPTPGTSINLLEEDSGRVVKSAHEAQIQVTIKDLVDLIPPSELAIQWDVVRETRSELNDELITELAKIADWVPEDVEVGYHLCFGDRKARGDVTARGMAEQGMTLGEKMKSHDRLSQPSPVPNGMTILRDMSLGIIAHASRRITFMHLATLPATSQPLEKAYADLDGLGDKDETECYLGLLDIDTGVEGTRRQIEAAARVLPRFGIGPECGLQRIDAREYQEALEALSTLAKDLSA
ncbi:MAG TPA: hypothetical protein VG845_13250, partial [Dehalococcoidia bacterium]|nr:hypothetical protein [Dehalococcoidia bacterium]